MRFPGESPPTIEESRDDFGRRSNLWWFLLVVGVILDWEFNTAQGLSGLELVLLHGICKHSSGRGPNIIVEWF